MELIPRFHQELFVYKTLQKIKEGKKNFLYGWKCRAGKTYGVGHLIDTFYKEFEHINALIITPAPSETLSQFGHEMFDAFINFKELNIVEIKKGSQLNELRINQNNVYIISKQLLDNYVKSDKKSNFHKQLFDLIICDENHFGGTTHKAEQIFKLFSSSDTHFIFLSATYQKTLLKYNIDHDCQFYWNIEDEQLCKKRNLKGLIEKHGVELESEDRITISQYVDCFARLWRRQVVISSLLEFPIVVSSGTIPDTIDSKYHDKFIDTSGDETMKLFAEHQMILNVSPAISSIIHDRVINCINTASTLISESNRSIIQFLEPGRDFVDIPFEPEKIRE